MFCLQVVMCISGAGREEDVRFPGTGATGRESLDGLGIQHREQYK